MAIPSRTFLPSQTCPELCLKNLSSYKVVFFSKEGLQ